MMKYTLVYPLVGMTNLEAFGETLWYTCMMHALYNRIRQFKQFKKSGNRGAY